MGSRRVITAAGLTIAVAFFALLAWRATVWHRHGWAGLRYISGAPDGFQMPKSLEAGLPKAGTIDIVLPMSPAERAGIRTRERIVSIDGISVRDFDAIAQRGDTARRGETITYRILSNGKEREVKVTLDSPLRLPSVAGGIAAGIVLMFGFLTIAFLVISHRPKARAALVFFWFCVIGTSWAAMVTFLDLDMMAADGIYSAFSRLPLFLFYLLALGVADALAAVLLHLSLVFPRELPMIARRRWLLGWMYCVPMTLALLPFGVVGAVLAKGIAIKVTTGVLLALVAVLLIARRSDKPWHDRPVQITGIAVTALLSSIAFFALGASRFALAILVAGTLVIAIFSSLVCAIVYGIGTIIALVRGYRGSTAEEKRQVRWPLWGTTITLGISLLVSGLLVTPSMYHHVPLALALSTLERLTYVLIPLSFAFAILKYRLMDIDVVIKKTVVYSIVTGVVVAVFFLVVAGIGSYLTARLNIRSQTLTVVATLAVAAVFVPLRNRVQRSVERRFFQRSYDASEAEKLIQQEIVSASSLEALLPRIAEYVQQALQVRAVVIFTPQRDDDALLRPAATIGVAQETIGAFALDRASIARIENVAEIGALRLSDEERARVRRLHAELVVPLALRGHTRGVMLIGSMLSGRFDEDDHRFLTDIAQQLAFAIEKLTVTEEVRDYERALEIQRALLPHALPRVEGVDIEAVWRPARTVGGDYYDVLQLGPSMLGLCIGDVAGKGMPAALLMANLQAAVKASASAELRPHEVCTKVSTVVNGTLTGGRFVTFFFGALDTRDRVLRYTNAGHNPPLLVRASGEVVRLAGGGPVFARMMHGSPYDTHEVQLRAGDTLLLFTDGATEARSIDEEEFGEPRLLDVARNGATASDVATRIVDEVQRFCGGAAQDDLTLLVVCV